jgi:hypothetical protein
MATITFSKFDLGIDLRKGASVSDANRLRDMLNAFVTTGLATQKRPGLVHVATLEAGTKGLVAALGKLQTFYGSGTVTHANTLFNANKAQLGGVDTAITKVHYADVFNGAIYASLEYTGGTIRHNYFDGGSSEISDVNCPHTASVIKAASKMFAIGSDGTTVRYCKTGDPNDWTAVSDAGFLPTGLNATGDREANALGLYQKKLVVLTRDAAQVWTVDPDPTAMELDDIVENVGTSYPNSLATVGGDLFFLSDYGFRSITTNKLIDKREDVDVGSPIDSLVKAALSSMTQTPIARYYYGTGQYLCAIDSTLYVYSLSRTSKIAAWSRYVIPVAVDAMAELDGVLYIRTGDDVYKLSEAAYTDGGNGSDIEGDEFEVMIEMPYMDFKTPGILKRIYAIDIVMEGECHFSLGWDVRNAEAVTDEVRIIGNTRGGGLIPIECCGTEFSPRFRNLTDEEFRLDALTIHYENLGPL